MNTWVFVRRPLISSLLAQAAAVLARASFEMEIVVAPSRDQEPSSTSGEHELVGCSASIVVRNERKYINVHFYRVNMISRKAWGRPTKGVRFQNKTRSMPKWRTYPPALRSHLRPLACVGESAGHQRLSTSTSTSQFQSTGGHARPSLTRAKSTGPPPGIPTEGSLWS